MLDRISALATVPVSVHDTREVDCGYYPQGHLAALTDRDARANLINGAHSLWYELVNLLLLQRADLDKAMAAVPSPVRTAIDADLETEASELRDALAEFSEEVSHPETESPR